MYVYKDDRRTGYDTKMPSHNWTKLKVWTQAVISRCELSVLYSMIASIILHLLAIAICVWPDSWWFHYGKVGVFVSDPALLSLMMYIEIVDCKRTFSLLHVQWHFVVQCKKLSKSYDIRTTYSCLRIPKRKIIFSWLK